MTSVDSILHAPCALVDGTWVAVSIAVVDGKIVALDALGSSRPAREVIDLRDRPSGCVVLPGLVDTHVHINDPGRDWEGFESATRAAAAGGVTTLVDMPLNSSPVTTSIPALDRKLSALRGACYVDVGLWGGLVPGNVDAIEPLLDAGVLGFKAFMVDSGIDEFPPVSVADLEAAMPRLASRDAVLLVHAESSEFLVDASGDPRMYTNYLASRPPASELTAIDRLVELSQATGCAVHIVHLATPDALERLAQARASGVAISIETCPHYLSFAAEDIPDGATEFKCAPPIRSHGEREGLWQGLRDGVIDLIASDHSPCPPGMKARESGDFFAAWGGIASLQLTLPAVWTAARRRGLDATVLGTWLCERPARLAGLAGRKGAIAIGYDADLVLCNLESSFTVDASRLYHRHPLTPYDGCHLSGVVEATWLRGRQIFGNGLREGPPAGHWIRGSKGDGI